MYSKFVNDTNTYLVGILGNLNRAKKVKILALEAKNNNWYKSNEIWPSNETMPLKWGTKNCLK